MLMDNAHRATSLFFFKHNIPFMAIDSPFFRDMIKAAQNCPVYTPAARFTLCNKQLDERNAEANKFKARLLESNLMFGFTITGDGYASLSKRQYHNHILVADGTPIFLGLVDRIGLGASGQDVAAEFQEVMGQAGCLCSCEPYFRYDRHAECKSQGLAAIDGCEPTYVLGWVHGA